MVLPVSDKFDEYAKKVHKQIFDAGFDVDVDLGPNLLAKKMALAQVAQYNFILVVGAKEEQNGTCNVRTRDNVVHGERTIEALIGEFQDLTKEYK
jgi:threonyl-tRNA synthetase